LGFLHLFSRFYSHIVDSPYPYLSSIPSQHNSGTIRMRGRSTSQRLLVFPVKKDRSVFLPFRVPSSRISETVSHFLQRYEVESEESMIVPLPQSRRPYSNFHPKPTACTPSGSRSSNDERPPKVEARFPLHRSLFRRSDRSQARLSFLDTDASLALSPTYRQIGTLPPGTNSKGLLPPGSGFTVSSLCRH